MKNQFVVVVAVVIVLVVILVVVVVVVVVVVLTVVAVAVVAVAVVVAAAAVCFRTDAMLNNGGDKATKVLCADKSWGMQYPHKPKMLEPNGNSMCVHSPPGLAT